MLPQLLPERCRALSGLAGTAWRSWWSWWSWWVGSDRVAACACGCADSGL